MKITKQELEQIIAEEYDALLQEGPLAWLKKLKKLKKAKAAERSIRDVDPRETAKQIYFDARRAGKKPTWKGPGPAPSPQEWRRERGKVRAQPVWPPPEIELGVEDMFDVSDVSNKLPPGQGWLPPGHPGHSRPGRATAVRPASARGGIRAAGVDVVGELPIPGGVVDRYRRRSWGKFGDDEAWAHSVKNSPISPGEVEKAQRAMAKLREMIEEELDALLAEAGENWIQAAEKDIKRRGTEGVCTGDKFGSESCPPGSRRYNLAKTFREMAKKKK